MATNMTTFFMLSTLFMGLSDNYIQIKFNCRQLSEKELFYGILSLGHVQKEEVAAHSVAWRAIRS